MKFKKAMKCAVSGIHVGREVWDERQCAQLIGYNRDLDVFYIVGSGKMYKPRGEDIFAKDWQDMRVC